MPETAAPDRAVADELCRFIDDSPSPYHAVATAAALLEAAGFEEVALDQPLPTGAAGRYVRRGGSLVAWRQPAGAVRAFRIVGAHTDSPNLRIKPRPDHVSAGVRQLGVEVYGGALLNSWLDRDLGLSGRVSVSTPTGPELRLVRIDEPLLRVPQLAIHLDREIMTEGLKLNPQSHLAPIWDLDGDQGSQAGFVGLLAERLDVGAGDVLAWDVMAHDLTPSRRTGVDGVFVSAPRLDNLCSSFAGLHGLARHRRRHPPRSPWCACTTTRRSAPPAPPGPTAPCSPPCSSASPSPPGPTGPATTPPSSARCACRPTWRTPRTRTTPTATSPSTTSPSTGVPVVKVNANQRYATDAESLGDPAAGLRATPASRRSASSPAPTCRAAPPSVRSPRPASASPPSTSGVAQLAMHSARELCGADDPSRYVATMAAALRG